jgi:hypothetical protein
MVQRPARAGGLGAAKHPSPTARAHIRRSDPPSQRLARAPAHASDGATSDSDDAKRLKQATPTAAANPVHVTLITPL